MNRQINETDRICRIGGRKIYSYPEKKNKILWLDFLCTNFGV